MKIVTCDQPGCKSYYQSHPTACNDIEKQLKDRGWQVFTPPMGESLFFCQAHKKQVTEPAPVAEATETDVA